ncbi:MAG UNVERIFIED_CONTAM: HEAT repeat domain-containing protein [Planctomycetaceae bacterium]
MERIAAAEALQGIGNGNLDAIAALLPVLSDPHAHTAAHAAAALAAQGSPAVPSLIPLLKNERQRNAVIEIFVEMGPAAEAALPELLKGIDDGFQSPISRRLALRAVGAMGPRAAAAVPRSSRSCITPCTGICTPLPHGYWEGSETAKQYLNCSGLRNPWTNERRQPPPGRL